MTSQHWKPAVTVNGSTSYEAKREIRFGFLTPLERMDGEGLQSLVLWHYPADEEFEHPEYLSNYIQCAGTARRLTVELRRTQPDGTYTHWVLGRFVPTGTESETIQWAEFSTRVHPEEVWTAADVAPLFDYYATHRTLPDTIHRRALDL